MFDFIVSSASLALTSALPVLSPALASALTMALTITLTATVTLATALLGLRYYNQLNPIPEAIPVGQYLQVYFSFRGKAYLTYLRHYPKMAAQGWRVSQPDGELINFYPGAIPTLTVSELQPDLSLSHVVVKKGARLEKELTELDAKKLMALV